MKKHCVRILSAFFGLAALALAAKAEPVDQIVVNIPYEFVVSGKTLPAGTYRVNRISDNNERGLLIRSFENGVAVMVFSSEVADKTRPEQPSVTFEQVGDQHLLSKIQTAEHVFTIPVPKMTILETAMKSHSGTPGSMSSGNN